MITLERDGVFMEVATELQASVFIRSGYKRVEAPAENTPDWVAMRTGETGCRRLLRKIHGQRRMVDDPGRH